VRVEWKKKVVFLAFRTLLFSSENGKKGKKSASFIMEKKQFLLQVIFSLNSSRGNTTTKRHGYTIETPLDFGTLLGISKIA